MTKEDKQIIDRAIKENWRIGDRTRLKRLLEKNLKLYRENEELKDHLAEEVELHLHAEKYIKSLEQQIEKMKADVKREQSYWNSCEMQYRLYQRLLDKWGDKKND